MITRCVEEQKVIIESYIGEEYYRCLYLYMNLKRYIIDSNEIKVYIDREKNQIRAVYLIYFSCLHVYSKDNQFDMKELKTILKIHHIRMIYCEKSIARNIWDNCIGIKDSFSVTYGYVAEISRVDMFHRNQVQLASALDFEQIIPMIYGDEDIGKSYNKDELKKQLLQRSKEGYSRNYVIKRDNLVIAHACTNAEMDAMAVVAELIVNKNYRRQGYALDIWRAICEDLLNEGKRVFSFYYSSESRNLHKKVGFREICEWGKIVIKN